MIVLYQPFQNPTIHCPAPSRLPPLSKGGGLTARHKLLLCCVLLAICPLFLYCKLFAVKTEGLLYHLSLSTTSMPPLSKVMCCRPKKFGRLPEGLPHHSSQNRTIPPTFRRGVGLPLPLHRPSPSPQPLQKDNTPSLRTTFLPYERSACFAS